MCARPAISGLIASSVLSGCHTACDAEVLPNEHMGLRVTWTSAHPGAGRIEAEADGEPLTATAVDDEKEHVAELYGAPPLTDVTWRAITSREGHDDEICEGVTTTLQVPAGFPAFTVSNDDADARSSERYLIGQALTQDDSWGFIIDRQGRAAWYREPQTDLVSVVLQWALDGDGLLQNVLNIHHAVDSSAVQRFSRAGDLLDSAETPQAHHVFIQLPADTPDTAPGTLAYLDLDVRPWTDPDTEVEESVVGDAITERAPDGTFRTVFSIWDWLEPAPNDHWDDPFYPQGRDWSHGSGLSYDLATDTYLYSMANEDTIVQIDRTSGEPIRWFGKHGWPVDGDSHGFMRPHGPRLLDDGTLLLFAGDPGDGLGSGGIRYSIDDGAQVLHEVWSYGFDDDVSNQGALGEATLLANDDVLVSYGIRGTVHEVTPDGRLVWQLDLAQGTWFGLVTAFQDFSNP
jgi:hypothetical protein